MTSFNNDGNLILQGWLLKEKRTSSVVATKTIKRWFVIEKTVDSDGSIVNTLSYYKSPRANYDDRCGWIFLSDVISLEELKEKSTSSSTKNAIRRKSIGGDVHWDEWIISIKHPLRIFRLRAQDRYQHRLWFHTLNETCQHLQRETHNNNKNEVDGNCPSSQQMDKLKPAGAFHKDSIDTRKSFSNNDERDISVELEFMRSINRTSAEGSFTKHKSFHEDESENSQSMLDLRDDSFMKIDQDTVCLDGGKLVYDEELIRLGYIRDPLQKHGKSYIDDDASIESCNDIIDITQANVHRIQKQESRTKLDHRLEFSKGLHCGDETIQKRLQRAMQSDDEQHLHLEFVNNESDAQDGMLLANQESSSPQCDDNIVTMVKDFSMEDFSDESFSKSSIEQQSFIVNDEDSIKESNQHTRRGLKSPSTMESYKLDDKANSTGKGIDSNSSVLHKNRRYSFDSDCSFLPDHDFATSNWDSD